VRFALAVVCLGTAACGTDGPCDNRDGACIALTVEGNVGRIDQLEVDLLYAGLHRTTSTRPTGGGTTGAPLELAIAIDVAGATDVGIVAAGKLSGNVLGTGSAMTMLDTNLHTTLTIVLAVPDDCTAGALYCGGDKVAGDPQTLYQCNGGGVPLARGVCLGECVIRPTDDDVCRGTGTCVDGSDYCGGDKLDGDPQVLYRCSGGVGINPRLCVDGCVVRPGDDDMCR
jgi:hypothetical protein